MVPEEFFKIIDYITLFQIVIFISLLASRKQIKFESKLFLIIFLTAIAVCEVDRLQYFYRSFINSHNFPHLYNTGDIFHLLYLPAFYFYAKSITTSEFKLKKRYLVHVLPALIVAINLVFNYYSKPTEIKFSLLNENLPFHTNTIQLRIIFLIHFLQTGYLIAIFFLLKDYQKQVRNYFSSYNKKQIDTLYIMLAVMLLIRLSSIISYLIEKDIAVHTDIMLAIYATVIIYLGYSQPKVFFQQTDPQKLQIQKSVSPATVKELTQLMELEKPYLDPDLTLNQLAEKIKLSPRELSFILNTDLQLSFFNFVNQYRIEEAKKMLSDKANKKTILEILYQVGFNNKSAFNRVFKDFTGVTPTKYRNPDMQ